ncbi:hypothetical protein NLI96_g1590 [Meripilus lineatus]|uniref:Uncharacterized protein n=1 Tax=Meripilus lineatus TaxID=2056292 RepID=A0AAD5VA94_9APHY|nr:hypothetical protein NLI96_g1590 [Physisporinus lineatus]
MPSTTPLLPAQPTDSTDLQTPSLPPPPPGIELTFLLGSAPTEHLRTLHSLYASQVATLVWVAEGESLEVERKGVIVGIALRPVKEPGKDGHLSARERTIFHGVMDMVKELISKE